MLLLQLQSRIDQYFTQLKRLQESKMFESRVRFNILDLCELRERGWVLRDNQKNKGPTTIAAIHNQAQQEEADRQVCNQDSSYWTVT